MNPKEDLLSIKEGNQRVIEAGMVFNLKISFANFDPKENPQRNCL